MLRAELVVSPASSDGKLRGGGHLIVNPPWTLEQDLKILLPALAKIFAPGVKDAVRLDWIGPEDLAARDICNRFAAFSPLSSSAALVFTDEAGFDVPPP